MNERRFAVRNVVRELGESDSSVRRRVADVAGVETDAINDMKLVRQSIDARGRRAPRFVLHFEITVDASTAVHEQKGGRVQELRPAADQPSRAVDPPSLRPVIIGLGPCGIFAALHLLEHGVRPIVIERGKPVETRAKDVSRLMGKGEINPESNLCFGEGGAGTWSDGKLYTRVGGPWIRPILHQLVEFGGPERILVDSRPHLGTDKLVAILKNARRTLLDGGCDILFERSVDRLELDTDGAVTGVRLDDDELVPARHVVLAPGHSARDLYVRLLEQKVAMTSKPFAVGFRIEHPQAFVDGAQYGAWSGHDELPAAYYELADTRGRARGEPGVFSFCMCPGGSIVPTPTNEGEVCVNGMSHAARSGHYANSAVVTEVKPEQFGAFGAEVPEGHEALAGMYAQLVTERHAWRQGGGGFVAPAQRASDYVDGASASAVRRTTYRRGVAASPLQELYPAEITESLQRSLLHFDTIMPGFVSDDAILVGVETRTSAPVRIDRDDTTLQSVSNPGLYPAGEGCGYGGGIMSAAIDGVRAAERILDTLTRDVLRG